MSLLLLDRAGLRIKSEGGALALYEADQRRGSVPVKLIERCIIHGASTQLDTGVLLKLADAGATTVIMSPRSPRRVAIVLGGAHNDAAVRIAQAQRVMDTAACQRWALALVRAKVARQLRLIGRLMPRRPDVRKPLFDAQHSIQPIWQQLRDLGLNTPAELPSLERLRGLEGAAARVYFGALTAVMPAALGFAGRNRRPPRDPVNACLSLGYTLLHTQAVAAAHSAGLDPLLGFYHRPACLLGKAGRAVFYAEWEKAQKPWVRWLRTRTRALAAELRLAGSAWVMDDYDHEPC